MVDVKTAVHNALAFVKGLYAHTALEGLALEEVRLSEDEQYWLVTVGFTSFSPHVSVGGEGPLRGLTPPTVERAPRDYKEVRVRTDTGEPEPSLIHREL